MTYGIKVPKVSRQPTEKVIKNFSPKNIVATAADVNGDGLDDLVMAGTVAFDPNPKSKPQPGIILLNDGKGGFKRAGGDGTFGFGSSELIVEDFNGDGILDIFIPDFGHDFEPFSGYPNQLLLGNGRGGFRDASDRLPKVSDATHSAAAGDIDGDGDMDLYVGNYDRRNPYLLINDGKANFTLDRKNLPESVAVGVTDFGRPRKALSSEFADMNGDGHVDLILGTEDNNVSWRPNDVNAIFLNDGTGRFSDDSVIVLPDNTVSRFASRLTVDVKAMDVNRDGLQDVILLQAPLEYGGWAVQILMQTSDGKFVDESTTRINGPTFSRKEDYSRFLRIEDVNGDGHDDIMLSDINDVSRPAFLMNTGFGSFLSVPGSAFGARNPMFEYGVNVALLDKNSITFADPFVWKGKPLLVTSNTKSVPEFEGLGGRTADVMVGDRGDDLMYGKGGGDRLVGKGGDDMIDGGKGKDVLRGDSGNDMLRGGSAKDQISGGAGGDEINGGKGEDLLKGGKGADDFQFNRGDGQDTIVDFRLNRDDIEITRGAKSFSQLDIYQRGKHAFVDYGGRNDLIKLLNTDADALDAKDFIF